MTTPVVLPENRWSGVYAPEPMRRLVDGFALAAAQRLAYPFFDLDNQPVNLLPFLAWQFDADAFDLEGQPANQRLAIRNARLLNGYVGTEEAFTVFLGTNLAVGEIEYNQGLTPLRDVSVDLYITPPPGRVGDARFLAYVVRVARRLFHYTLGVNAVHILSRWTANIYVVMAARPVITGVFRG